MKLLVKTLRVLKDSFESASGACLFKMKLEISKKKAASLFLAATVGISGLGIGVARADENAEYEASLAATAASAGAKDFDESVSAKEFDDTAAAVGTAEQGTANNSESKSLADAVTSV